MKNVKIPLVPIGDRIVDTNNTSLECSLNLKGY